MNFVIQRIRNKFKDIVFVYQYYLGIRFLVSFLTSVIIVKSAMNLVDIGFFEINMFIVLTLSFGWSVGFKNALLSLFPKSETSEIPLLISSAFWTLFVLSFVTGTILYLIPDSVVQLITDYEHIPYIKLGAIYLFISVPSVLIENIFYLKQNTRKLLNYTHWSQALQIISMMIVAIFYAELSSFLYCLIFISLTKLLYLVFFVLKSDIFRFELRFVKNLLVFSGPLILYVLLGSGMDLIDGLFVTHFYDDHFFAIFKYGAREMPFSSLLFSSLSTAMIPVLMNHGIGSFELKQRCTKLMHFVFPIALVLMVCSPFLFEIVYSTSFKESAFIFNVYLLILTSRVLLPQTYNFALHQHKIVVWSGLVEIIINVILSLWLVQYFGVYGLAMATVIAYLIQKSILIVYNNIVNGIKLHQYIDLKWYSIYSILLIIFFIITLKLQI